MPAVSYRQISSASSLKVPALTKKAEIQELHEKCGIYTKPEVVRNILDGVGWSADAQLFRFRLLEPAAGDGAFLIEAARRLILSCRAFRVTPRVSTIGHCIRAFELHPGEAKAARLRVSHILKQLNVHSATANALAQRWITCADFLLTSHSGVLFTHVVGNPPYVRWSKIPSHLQRMYKHALPRGTTGGDLFLPFLDRSLEQLTKDGKCGFVCSDRWRFMAFAESFRRKWLPRLHMISEVRLAAASAFERSVDAYPTAFVAARVRATPQPQILSSAKRTIAEAGFIVKVGPALGHTAAFVLQPDEDDVEAELLRPWIEAPEVLEGKIHMSGKRVIAMHDRNGLIALENYPMLAARLKRFRSTLSKRSIVRNGAPWYKTIDRVEASVWARPKLLIPELAKVPRIAIDRSGAIPSHGVYAIFAGDQQIEALYGSLSNGGLARALEGIAPKVKGGFVRCYKRFLNEIRVP